MTSGAPKPEKLIPPDLLRCQVEWRDYRPFTMGGDVWHHERCAAPPAFVAMEKARPHGTMSMCAEHRAVYESKHPRSATFTPVAALLRRAPLKSQRRSR